MLRIALAVATVVVILDQLSKWLVRDVIMQPPQVIEITSFFNLVITYNKGISFGLFGGGGGNWQPWFFTVLALCIVSALLLWVRHQSGRTIAIACGLIVGGAVGNVIDRIRLNAVIDFLDFHLGTWHWPAFNVADSTILLGVALLLIDNLLPRREMRKIEK